MSLVNPKIVLNTRGRGRAGFTFSVLGDLLPNGSDYQSRSQGENPEFTADFSGNPFLSGIEYKFEIYHPEYADDAVLLRYTFDADGNLLPSSPAEDSANAGANGDESLDTTGARSTFTEITAPDQFAAYQHHPNQQGKVLVRGMSADTAAQFLQFPLAKYTREITPQMFGATGHPLGNDTQALIAWITTGGDYIHVLPAGTYNCTTSLDRYNLGGVTIRGAGSGKSILAFSGDTAGLVVVNNTLIYTGGIVVLEDFTVTSTGPKTGYNDAVYLTTKQQRPGPSIRGVKVISQVVGQEWKTGVHFHNCSGINAYDLDIEGLGTAMGNQFAVQVTADPGNVSVEHLFTRVNIRNLKRGYDVHSPETGETGIEGITITDGQIVGVETGIVAISHQASPAFTIKNTHINAFGGEAIHLEGFQQVDIDSPGAPFYVNPGPAGLSPAATPQYAVYIKDPVLCSGRMTVVTFGNSLHQVYFAGNGGGVDMEIKSIVEAAPTNSIYVEAGIGAKFKGEDRIWRGNPFWGTTQGDYIASDLSKVLMGLSVVGTAITPPDKHILQYNAPRAVWEANSMIRAKRLSTLLVSTSRVIDPTLYELIRVNNGPNDITLTINRANYSVEGGEVITFERYDETCTGTITIKTSTSSINLMQRFDRRFVPLFVWPHMARQKTVTFWNNTVHMEMMDGQGDQAWSTIVVSASATIDPSKYNLVRINNGSAPILIVVDTGRYIEAGGQEIVFQRLNETSTGTIQIQTISPDSQRIQTYDGTLWPSFSLPTTPGQRSAGFWWTTVNFEMLPGGGSDSAINPGVGNPTINDIAYGFSKIWKNTTTGEVNMWVNDNGVMKVLGPFKAQTTTTPTTAVITIGGHYDLEPIPLTIKNYRISGPTDAAEDSTSVYRIIIVYSDDSEGAYTGGGQFDILGYHSPGLSIATGDGAVGTLTAAADSIDADTTVPLQFELPSGIKALPFSVVIRNAGTVIDPNANAPTHSDMSELHGNGFSVTLGNNPINFPSGYTLPNGGNWNWGSDTLCQTNPVYNRTIADEVSMLFTGNSNSSSLGHSIAVVKVKPTMLTADSRIGLGLQHYVDRSGGYNFLIKDSNTVCFLHDGIAFGPSFAYSTQVNTWYWMKLKSEDNGAGGLKLSGKIWKAGEVEPSAWLVWNSVPSRSGYPALIGGVDFGSGASTACFDDWYDGVVPGSVSPVIGYTIPGISIPEGQSGTAQVYAVHGDGSQTEVAVANGSSFQLLGQYPNGMGVSYGNTARALVQTAADSVTANVPVTIRFTFADGTTVDGTVTVVNANPNPCSNYFMHPESEINALPIVMIFEYLDDTSMAPGFNYTVRSFTTRLEAITNIGVSNGKYHFDMCRCTTSSLSVGDTLYGDNRPEHIQDSTFDRWPAGGGWWGFDLYLPENGQNGYYILFQTDQCGIIITRETITLYAN